MDGCKAPRTVAVDTFHWGSGGNVVMRIGTQKQHMVKDVIRPYFCIHKLTWKLQSIHYYNSSKCDCQQMDSRYQNLIELSVQVKIKTTNHLFCDFPFNFYPTSLRSGSVKHRAAASKTYFRTYIISESYQTANASASLCSCHTQSVALVVKHILNAKDWIVIFLCSICVWVHLHVFFLLLLAHLYKSKGSCCYPDIGMDMGNGITV